ncbi:peptidyl-prolyl cis-trans isomerase [Fragilaria crotonensis]|nr:peptidyl-prolyl cis-trans isomerase [Fragilaria crotonensis]
MLKRQCATLLNYNTVRNSKLLDGILIEFAVNRLLDLHGATCCVITLLVLIVTTWLYGWNVVDNNDATPQVKHSFIQRRRYDAGKCAITSISDLSDAELRPKSGLRHMVTPPQGGKLTLVCCETTKGNVNLLIHQKWAPIGVARFLEMVESNYFETRVPLFRCTDACQFGLAGDPEATKRFNTRLQDDPMWLPPGIEHRQNELGVKRFPPGLLHLRWRWQSFSKQPVRVDIET